MIPTSQRSHEPDDTPATAEAKRWWPLAILGFLSIVFGVLITVWPGVTLMVFATILGAWLLISGLLRIVEACTNRAGLTLGWQVLSGVLGVLFVLGGLICLRNLGLSLILITFLIGLKWLFTGIIDLMAAFTSTGQDRLAPAVYGALSLAIGVVFLILPLFTLEILVLVTGIGAIVIGVVQVASALQVRGRARRQEP